MPATTVVMGFLASIMAVSTPLSEGLVTHSRDGLALPGLYLVLANEDLFFAVGCDGIETWGDASIDRDIPFLAAEYRDGGLFYAFENQESLSAWAEANSLGETCWIRLSGNEFLALMGEAITQNYTVINVETAPVLITPQDWVEVSRLYSD